MRAALRVVALVSVMAPVDTVPMPIVPLPLALIVRLVLLPLSMAATATVPPVAAPVTLSPAACDPVELSTTNAGLVAPASPTARATAEADVIVADVDAAIVVNDPASGVDVPIITLLI